MVASHYNMQTFNLLSRSTELLQNDLVPMHAAVETLASGSGVALFVSV